MSQPEDSPFQTLHEFVKEAKGRLSPGNWDYLVGATETETTMMRNRAAIDSLAFRPRVLRDVSQIDFSGRFLGKPITLPVMLAPVGGLEDRVLNEPGTRGDRVAEHRQAPHDEDR